MSISVTILVKDGARHLQRVLEALQTFAEVIVYDTGSQDASPQIAQSFANVRFFTGPFTGFGECHNTMASLAHFDWILSVDADEIVSRPLVEEIHALSLHPHTVYAFPFHNFFNDKHITTCGWYPDVHIRLYNRTTAQFSTDHVHEGVQKGSCTLHILKNPVLHYSYTTVSDFFCKMERYSQLFAKQNAHKKKVWLWSGPLHGAWAFFKSYILKRGFMQGWEGLLISAYNGHTAFYKYMLLYHYSQKRSSCS